MRKRPAEEVIKARTFLSFFVKLAYIFIWWSSDVDFLFSYSWRTEREGVVIAADVVAEAASQYGSQEEKKLKLTKNSREDDIKIARTQILQWQKLLLQVCY